MSCWVAACQAAQAGDELCILLLHTPLLKDAGRLWHWNLHVGLEGSAAAPVRPPDVLLLCRAGCWRGCCAAGLRSSLISAGLAHEWAAVWLLLLASKACAGKEARFWLLLVVRHEEATCCACTGP
jgi:hypothetical protein